ncbi:MAG: RloB domain-containing protein [Rhodospirillales bacterium]|nr:RloB domain-containing protein [Acetobacter sp.]
MSPPRRGRESLGRSVARPRQLRQSNRIFYIVAEGERTEYEYFGHIYREYGRQFDFSVKVPTRSVIKNGLSPSQVIDEAATVIGEPDISEVWGLFDHDRRTTIDRDCAAASRHNVSVALSHPAFELWLLLHFQDFSPARQDGSSVEVIRKLRSAHPAFVNYSADNKGISLNRFEALVDNEGIVKAVQRAKRLAAEFVGVPPGNRDPSTGVHSLIEALGIVRKAR